MDHLERYPPYPWIKESSEILRPYLPCSEQDARELLMRKMTHRAVQSAVKYRGASRLTAANTALAHLKAYKLKERDGVLEFRLRSDGARAAGVKLLLRLKTERSVKQDTIEGFAASTVIRYRCVMRGLGWISLARTIDGQIWHWTGPDDAVWSSVPFADRRKSRKEAAVQEK